MEAVSVMSKCTTSSSITQAWLTTLSTRVTSGGSRSVPTISTNFTFQKRLRVRKSTVSGKICTVMRWGGEQDKDSGEERPETLFMRELAKRKKLGQDVGMKETDTKTKEQEAEPKGMDERDAADQRKRSMALNSEGLDGLVPRGEELVKLGSTFWLSSWPFIAASIVFFLASYLYFGPAFVHGGSQTSPPPYVDPYMLLESEELPPQVGPNQVPFNTYRSPQ